MKAKLIFILFLLICIFPFVMASPITDLSVMEKGYSYIQWGWNGTANNASIDGLKINQVDVLSNSFILSDLSDNETHKFCVYSSTNSECNISKLDLTPKSSSEKIADFSLLYLWVFITILLLIGSIWIKPLSTLAFIFSLIGILQGLNTSFYVCLIFGVTTIISAISMRFD